MRFPEIISPAPSDPRNHPHARAVDGDRITYVCNCVNEIHRPSGVLRCVEKCLGHGNRGQPPPRLGMSYFEDLGAIKVGVPQCAHYLRELEDALGAFPPAIADKRALEIGCGCSMYAPGLLRAGYAYEGVEPSPWAAKWTASAFDVPVSTGAFEAFAAPPRSFGLILAAHCLEHVDDAPGAIRRCADLLAPGGELWIVIPDDTDPLNPDHLWFFSQSTLRACLAAAGLVVDELQVRRRVAHENFLYARAWRP